MDGRCATRERMWRLRWPWLDAPTMASHAQAAPIQVLEVKP